MPVAIGSATTADGGAGVPGAGVPGAGAGVPVESHGRGG